MSRTPHRKAPLADPGPLRLADSIDHQPKAAAPAVERLTLRLDEVAAALGVSRRLIERERSAGRFPPPDRTIGRVPLWSRQTLIEWIASGAGRP
ncbi:MAG: helix-turn-helix transcriptional regulator [Isosphaeraceae bacterium]